MTVIAAKAGVDRRAFHALLSSSTTERNRSADKTLEDASGSSEACVYCRKAEGIESKRGLCVDCSKLFEAVEFAILQFCTSEYRTRPQIMQYFGINRNALSM